MRRPSYVHGHHTVMTMRSTAKNSMRLGLCALFMLSLALQGNIGHAASACWTSESAEACHGGSASTTAVRLQNPCCCPELTQCHGLEMAVAGDAAEVTAPRLEAPAAAAKLPRLHSVRPERQASSLMRLAHAVDKPPLHILNLTLLI